MKTYSEILHDLKTNGITFDRWYTIDNFFYFVVKGVTVNNYLDRDQLVNKLSQIFVEPTLFKAYDNTFCIDMNKQIGTINTYMVQDEKAVRVGKMIERIKSSAYHFEL